MSKLHELIPLKDSYRAQAEACRADLKNTFDKKGHHFTERIVTLKSLRENEPDKSETQIRLETRVGKELDWISEKIRKAIDASHRVNIANMTARADVLLEDGTTVLSNVPATTLLELEKRIEEIQDLVKAIPTLDPAKGYELDPQRGSDGIYKARDVEKPRTEKVFSFTVMVPPTDKHPAQVKEHMNDIVVGSTLTQEWSSMLTTAQKGDMLDRTEDLMRAVKKARSKANDADFNVRDEKVGQSLLDYVFRGKTS